MKKIIATVLIFVLILFSLSSCGLITTADELINKEEGSSEDRLPDADEIPNYIVGIHPEWNFYPKGYTAGFPRSINKPAPRIEFWWVETYEECLEAMELLESHGSTFAKTAIFTHDGELFDTKYCFEICLNHRGTEEIEFGDNPFDRRATGVEVTSFAFFDDVTIDEINHSYVYDYEVYSLNPLTHIIEFIEQPPVFGGEDFSYIWDDDSHRLTIYHSDKKIFHIGSFGYGEDPEKAVECLHAVFDTMVFIGFE